MSDVLLSAHGVTVRFGGVVALDDVSIDVPAGAITGLVGPNGAGKTTMFGVVSGLLRPRSAHVELGGVDISRATPQRRAELGLARTFQRLELFGELSVREHLVVAHRVSHGRNRSFVRDLVGAGRRPLPGEDEAVDAALALLGLDAVAERPVGLLPLGSGRLVEIGRALATEPRVVLLDEPTSGLDAQASEHVAATLRLVCDEREVAFLLVEHDVELVLALASTVTVLDFGRIIATGSPDAIRADAGVRAAYLGDTARADTTRADTTNLTVEDPP